MYLNSSNVHHERVFGAYGTNEIFKTKLQMIPQYFVNYCQF